MFLVSCGKRWKFVSIGVVTFESYFVLLLERNEDFCFFTGLSSYFPWKVEFLYVKTAFFRLFSSSPYTLLLKLTLLEYETMLFMCLVEPLR